MHHDEHPEERRGAEPPGLRRDGDLRRPRHRAGGARGRKITLQGVGRIEAENVILGVTGGNGDFQNARGQATFDYTTKDQATFSFELIP